MSVKYIMADKQNKDAINNKLNDLYKQSRHLRSINEDDRYILDEIDVIQDRERERERERERMLNVINYTPHPQPTNTVEYFVEALRNKNFSLVLSLAEENNTYKCFLQEYMDEIKACKEKTYDCIQDVIDRMFVKYVKEYDNYDCVKLLLKIGVNNINKLELYDESDYMTPIQLWAGRHNKDYIELLINNNADVNVPNESGKSALIQASWLFKIDVINLLLQNGADVNAPNNNDTPLYIIIHRNNLDLVKLFVDKGANINLKYGRLPLITASDYGYFDIVEHLLKKGADPNINRFERTALEIASRNNHTEVVELLKKYGAKN